MNFGEVICTVNGRPIKPVSTRFGTLYAVRDDAGVYQNAFSTLEKAKDFAVKGSPAPKGN